MGKFKTTQQKQAQKLVVSPLNDASRTWELYSPFHIEWWDGLFKPGEEGMTPPAIVSRMVEAELSMYYSCASEPPKVLDPFSGSGSFLLCTFFELLEKHHDVEPFKIFKNCIYGWDNDKKKINLQQKEWIKLLSECCPEMMPEEIETVVKKNVIIVKDALKHYNNRMKFDVIIGNPPYNKGKRSSASGSGNSIWEKFLPAMWSHLQNDGYVCFVHPPEWRTNRYSRSKRNASKLMFDNQIKWIRAAFPFPGAGCSVDAYVLQKTNGQRQETIWENADGSIHKFVIEQDAPYLASMQSAVINKILGKVLSQKNQDFYERKAMGGLIVLDNTTSGEFTFVSGAKFTEKKQAHPHIHQFKMKVIMSDNRAYRPFFDPGTLGIGDHVHYALVKSPQEGQWLIHLINSKLSRWMQWIFCEGYNASKGVHGGEPWNCARPLSLINFADEETDGNDMYFYKHFDLTQEEIAYVESTVK